MEEKKILIVEDEEDIRAILELLLSQDYNPILAASGKEALEILKREKDISLAIFDGMLEDMNGCTLAEYARSDKGGEYAEMHKKYAEIPIIMISSTVEEGFKKRAEELVNLYMRKPFDRKELLDNIKELLGEKTPERTKTY